MVVSQQRLGALLVDMGFIDDAQLESALEEQRRSEKRLGKILVEGAVLSEDRLVHALSRQLGIEACDPIMTRVHERVLALIPPSVAFKHRVLPVARQREADRRDVVYVATSDPLDPEALRAVTQALGESARVQWMLAGETEMELALARHYGQKKGSLPQGTKVITGVPVAGPPRGPDAEDGTLSVLSSTGDVFVALSEGDGEGSTTQPDRSLPPDEPRAASSNGARREASAAPQPLNPLSETSSTEEIILADEVVALDGIETDMGIALERAFQRNQLGSEAPEIDVHSGDLDAFGPLRTIAEPRPSLEVVEETSLESGLAELDARPEAIEGRSAFDFSSGDLPVGEVEPDPLPGGRTADLSAPVEPEAAMPATDPMTAAGGADAQPARREGDARLAAAGSPMAGDPQLAAPYGGPPDDPKESPADDEFDLPQGFVAVGRMSRVLAPVEEASDRTEDITDEIPKAEHPDLDGSGPEMQLAGASWGDLLSGPEVVPSRSSESLDVDVIALEAPDLQPIEPDEGEEQDEPAELDAEAPPDDPDASAAAEPESLEGLRDALGASIAPAASEAITAAPEPADEPPTMPAGSAAAAAALGSAAERLPEADPALPRSVPQLADVPADAHPVEPFPKLEGDPEVEEPEDSDVDLNALVDRILDPGATLTRLPPEAAPSETALGLHQEIQHFVSGGVVDLTSQQRILRAIAAVMFHHGLLTPERIEAALAGPGEDDED